MGQHKTLGSGGNIRIVAKFLVFRIPLLGLGRLLPRGKAAGLRNAAWSHWLIQDDG